MKCIPGKASRTNCLKCNSQGRVVGYKSPMVDMDCPNCGATWRTISSICECCHSPSGTPYYTDCKHCVGKKKHTKES
ncbi:hypothetical protein SPSIL_008710 [Sporomusa silvacetica DSM 10669]|uniref:Uncharacterized protein n=1 Tax=Sporomusa silvacetica DSM 10669 TaxID=1123289 RepID=A0ABZ3IGG0_9FIRM|nr:hypothetical protein SPSIL_56250 [Sporomusa silvacetica DSM 10669]